VAAEFEGTLGGRPVHGVYTVTSSGFGFMSGLRACAAASWDARKLLLGRVLEGVRITSTSGPSSQGVMLPRNNPLDDSTIMSSWNARNESQDRTSQAWSNATLGVEQVQSESTGELWTVSQNAWWATGPQGPGYYREVPGGGYEQLEVVGQ